MTAEQLLLIAREFCARRNVVIVDFSALVAAAAVVNAKIDGIAVHGTAAEQVRALEKVIVALRPLSDGNEKFAQLCSAVLTRHWASR